MAKIIKVGLGIKDESKKESRDVLKLKKENEALKTKVTELETKVKTLAEESEKLTKEKIALEEKVTSLEANGKND